MPSFGAATWIPGLFLERPLYIRSASALDFFCCPPHQSFGMLLCLGTVFVCPCRLMWQTCCSFTNFGCHTCVNREINDGLYRPITYLCAKFATEFVMVIINSLIWPTLIFFSGQLKGQWILFFLVSAVALSTAVSEPLSTATP